MIPNDLLIDVGTLSILLISGLYLVVNYRKMKKLEKRLTLLASLKVP